MAKNRIEKLRSRDADCATRATRATYAMVDYRDNKDDDMTADKMPQVMLAKLRKSLIEHEDYRKYPYIDTVGKITIGIGYNLSDRGVDDDWILDQYNKDVNFFYVQISSQFEWYKDLTIDRQIVLIDMAFMGWKKFLTFNKMLNALMHHDYKKAADEMLNSKWAEQVKGRATTLAQAMLTGTYNI
jgi:lysozyme